MTKEDKYNKKVIFLSNPAQSLNQVYQHLIHRWIWYWAYELPYFSSWFYRILIRYRFTPFRRCFHSFRININVYIEFSLLWSFLLRW